MKRGQGVLNVLPLAGVKLDVDREIERLAVSSTPSILTQAV
jgi:hypothetical protein